MSYQKTLVSVVIATALAGCGAAEVKDDELGTSSRVDSSTEVVIQEAIQEPVNEPMTSEVNPKLVAVDVVASAATQEMNHEMTAVQEIPVDLPADTHVISLLTKTAKHPFFGVGDKTGFVVDGEEGSELVLERGKTYRFIVRSTPMHDVYISGDEMGWGAKVVEDGVDGNFTYEGEMVITPNEKTPDVVFYQCQNHKAMGARLFVVDQGDTRSLEQLVAEHGVLNEAKAGARVSKVSDAEIKQKLSYASLVFMSKPAKRVLASSNVKAKELLSLSKQKINEARTLHSNGDNASAMSLIDTALRNMSLASQMVPSEGLKEEQKLRYAEAKKHLVQQRVSHAEAVTRMTAAGEGAVAYDEAAVVANQSEAEVHARNDEYAKALLSIQAADKLVTLAINEMLDSQTVKYELNLDTPEGEYKYEHDRYLGYAELIPVAIEEKKPSAGQLSLLETFVKKGDAMRVKAEAMASDSNYPDAIRLMQEATKQVRRALRMLGVKQ